MRHEVRFAGAPLAGPPTHEGRRENNGAAVGTEDPGLIAGLILQLEHAANSFCSVVQISRVAGGSATGPRL